MLFFAMFDPVELLAGFDADIAISRQGGYAIGFFFFWMISAGATRATWGQIFMKLPTWIV